MALSVERGSAHPLESPTLLSSFGRSAFAGGLGALAGGVAAGVTLRLAMRAVALLEPRAIGQVTEAGAVVGTITSGGSVFLVVFGTGFGVVLGSVMIVAFARLIPGGTLIRALLFGLAMLSIFGSGLVTSTNRDFALFATPVANVLLFSAPFVVAGFMAVLVDEWVDGRLPAAGARRAADRAFVVVAGLAILLVVLALISLFGNVGSAPLLVVLYVLAVAYGLVRHASTGAWVPKAGRVLLVSLCVAGGLLYANEVTSIIGRDVIAG